jgi:hypothetical protein
MRYQLDDDDESDEESDEDDDFADGDEDDEDSDDDSENDDVETWQVTPGALFQGHSAKGRSLLDFPL